MTAAETDTRYCRDEGRRKSSAKLPTILEGGEDAAVLVNVHAHDVHLPSSSKRNIERNSTQVSMATDVRTISVLAIDNSESYKQGKKHGDQTEGVYVNSTSVANINGLANQSNVTLVGKEVHAREEDLMHNVGDCELGFVSGDKQMGIREETLGELHALDDLSQEKGRKKARVTGSFDTSAVDPIRETYDSRTRDVETNTNSCEVLSNTSFQQEMDGNVKEDSVQLENPIITGKNKKRKKSILVTSKDVSARQMTGPSTGAVEVPKTIGDCASDIEMTSRDKTKAIPADMLLSSSPLNSVSQVTKHVQLGTDAQATSDLAADQSNIGLVHEGYRNLVVGDISISTCKVVAGEEKSAEGISDGDHDENAVDACKDFLETVDNISQEKNCKKSKKASSVGLTSMGTAEAKDQCRYSEKAGKSDIISTQQEIVNDPYKRQTASNLKQGDCKENPNDDVKRKKKRRHNTESSNDVPTQDVTKSSGFIMNASSTENTSTHCLDAKQITLGNIGEETADEKNQCRLENVVEPVIVSNQGADVNDPSNVQQGNLDVIKDSNGDGKRKKKKKRHLESSKDDPTQDVTKPSRLITPGTIGEATVSDCRKVDETVDLATTNMINEVLADLRCTDNLSKALNGDPLTEQTKGGAGDALPSSAIQSDPCISSPSHKSEGKPVKKLSTVLDLSGLPDENISAVKDVLTEKTVVPANGRTKSTKRQRNKVSLEHVPTDSGKAIQSLGEQVRDAPAEDLKGENCTKAELFQGGFASDASASTGQIIQRKSKRSSKTRTPKIEEVNHSTHGHENQFAEDSQEKHVINIGGTHNNDKTVGAPVESPVVHKDYTTVPLDKPNNAQKGRKKSSKNGSDADFMNSRAQQGAVIPEGSSDAVEPNDYVAVHPDNSKINFIDHFNPSATNGPSDSAKNNDDTIREVVKGKKKSKRKADTESQHAGSIEPNDLPASDVHTDKTRLADHFGTGNVGVPSVSAENMNREDGNVKKAKEKKKSKTKPDLLKPKSQNPNGGNQDTDNCTQDLMHSDAQTGRIEHDYANENTDKVIQNGSMLQQETENATRDSTLEKNPHLSMFGADSKTDLLIEKDHAHISKEQRNSTSQTKRHAKSTNNDVSIDGRTSINPNAVSNPVQSFPMSPQASNESAYGTPAANKFRVAVRKLPRKIYEQVKGKSKKDSKRGTGTIFDDTISESSDEVLNTMGEKAAMENSSSTSAGSGISSAAWDGGEVPDDDDIVSLSQKSDIHSILRGSRSYKKARLKPTEPLDDTEVPDSQPLF